MYLVDTNVWLELLLKQEQYQQALAFLEAVDSAELAITDFALDSIGVILVSKKKPSVFEDFLSDIMVDSAILRIRLEVPDFKQAISIHRQHGLDFDDAYQYVAAEKHDLTIVSFDAHFDRTPRGRQTPAQVLADRAEEQADQQGSEA